MTKMKKTCTLSSLHVARSLKKVATTPTYQSNNNNVKLWHFSLVNTGVEVEAFENIQVYNIVAHIMELAPAPNNGSLDKVKHIFA